MDLALIDLVLIDVDNRKVTHDDRPVRACWCAVASRPTRDPIE
jgi:hypothetical protein